MDVARGLVLGLEQTLASPQADSQRGLSQVSTSHPPQGGGKVNGGVWEGAYKLQTTVLQSAISDAVDRPVSVGQDRCPASHLDITGQISSVSCWIGAGIPFS